MSPRPFINDALWICLCPRYNPDKSLVAVIAGGSASTRQSLAKRKHSEIAPFRSRSYNITSTPHNDPFALPNEPSRVQRPHKQTRQADIFRNRENERTQLANLPTPELYEKLRFDGAAGRYWNVMRTVEVLIKERGEKPHPEMYNAILHSFADAEEGTGGKIRSILAEMDSVAMELDLRGVECVLAALAVHPDCLQRAEVLDHAKSKWFALSVRAHNFIAAGLLRERLFEQALDKLEDMLKQNVQVQRWLWDKTMWTLLEHNELEEVFHVLSLREKSAGGLHFKMGQSLVQRLLDAAAKHHFADPAHLIWNAWVTSGFIKPPSGTCLNVLSLAARAGLVKLATDVFRVLAARNEVFTPDHYESLIECYLCADNLPAALSAINIMQEAGLAITLDSLHPLHTYLSKSKERPLEAFKLLQGMALQGERVPVVAVNSCLQACVMLDDLPQAIEIYKALHTIVFTRRPDTTTFNILFQSCHRKGRKAMAMYLATEMNEIGIKPDYLTYDRLILVCTGTDDISNGFNYYHESKEAGFTLRQGTHEKLIRCAVDARDSRVVALVRDYKANFEELVGCPRVFHFEAMVKNVFREPDELEGLSI